MSDLERTSYIQFAEEFESELNRSLTRDEKEFLRWLAKEHSLEVSTTKRKNK